MGITLSCQSVHISRKPNNSQMDELIPIKLNIVIVHVNSMRMCIKEDNPSLTKYQGR